MQKPKLIKLLQLIFLVGLSGPSAGAKPSDLTAFIISGKVYFIDALATKAFSDVKLDNIDCDFYSSPGSLWGPMKEPSMFRGTIKKNELEIIISKLKFTKATAPAVLDKSLKANQTLSIEPQAAKFTRFVHYCEGYTTTFYDLSRKVIALIVYAEDAFSISGSIVLADKSKAYINVKIPERGFHVLIFAEENGRVILQRVEDYKLGFTLGKAL